jgi:chromosome segregation ATPase
MDSVIADALVKRAHDVAARLKQQERSIEADLAEAQEQLAEIQKRQAELEAALVSVRGADERARDFIAMRGPNYQCPECFVEHEARAALGTETNIPTKRGEDVLVCKSRGCQIFFRNGTLG